MIHGPFGDSLILPFYRQGQKYLLPRLRVSPILFTGFSVSSIDRTGRPETPVSRNIIRFDHDVYDSLRWY